MIAKPLLGFGGIAGHDGIDDLLMLGERVPDAMAGAKLKPPVRFQAVVKLSSLFCQIGVVASLIDGLMKAIVGVVVGI